MLGLEPLHAQGSDAVEHPDLERLALDAGRRAVVDHRRAVLDGDDPGVRERAAGRPGDEPAEGEHAAQGPGVAEPEDDVSLAEHARAPSRCQRAIAGFMGSGGSSPADRARVAAGPQKLPAPVGRFHPVGRFRRPSFVGGQRDHPGDEVEHGESPGASRGVWAKASSTLPGPLLVLGKPPCTEMALSWATARASSRSEAHWWFVAETRIRHRIAGPSRSIPLRRTRSSFKLTAMTRPETWSCVQHPARRDPDLAAHRSRSWLRGSHGLPAMRILPHSPFHKSFTTDLTPKRSQFRPFFAGTHRARLFLRRRGSGTGLESPGIRSANPARPPRFGRSISVVNGSRRSYRSARDRSPGPAP